MIAVLKFLTKANKVRYHEYYPAAFQMDTDGTTFSVPPEQLVSAIQSVSPAAVQYTPITATYGVPLPFVFSGDPVIELLDVSPFESDPFDLRNLQVQMTDLTGSQCRKCRSTQHLEDVLLNSERPILIRPEQGNLQK